MHIILNKYLSLVLLFMFLSHTIKSAHTEEITPSENLFVSGDYEALFLDNLKRAKENPKESYLPLLITRDINKQFLSKTNIGKNKLIDLINNKTLTPLSNNLAQQMLASIYSIEGNEYKATELRRESGIIPTWRIAGAFGEYEQASFYQSFAPEGGIDFSIFMKGLGKDVTWRLMSENVCLNGFTPYKWISPQRGVLYLYTQFKLQKENYIVLEKNGQGAFSFWVDGIECGTSDFMQKEVGKTVRFKSLTTLSSGWHRLLVKLYADNKDSEEIFRILSSDLKPIENIEYDLKQLHGENHFGKALWKKLEHDISTYTTAEQALYYQYNQEYDKALTKWQEAINNNPDNPALHIYYATCAGQAFNILPGPMRTSIVKREALKALELYPEAISALLILGDHERQNKRYSKSDFYYSKVLEINPKNIIAYGAKIRIALENDWFPETSKWLENLSKLYPDSYISCLLKSIYYNRLGQIKQSAEILEKAYKLDRNNIIIATDCIRAYFASDNTAKALEILDSLPLYYKERVEILLLKSEILSRTGKFTKAINSLKQSLEAVGNDPGILKIQGDIFFTAKDYARAKKMYKESLELDSGNYSLRRLLAGLEGKNYKFWTEFSLNTTEKIDEFIKNHTKYFGSTARLIDQTVLAVHNGGGYSNYTHELQAVLTESGINKAAIVDTYGELLQARTILPERSRSLEPIILKGSRNITMPAVAPGAIIEHAYLNETPTPHDKHLRFPKWYFRSPNSQESFLFSQYIVRVPKGVEFTYATRNLDGEVEFTVSEEEDGTKNYIWTGKNMPEAIHEEGSPAIGSTLPYVAIALNHSWNDIHSSMLTSYLGKTIPTIDIINKVNELSRNTITKKDVIKNIYNFVNREITPSGSRSPASHILLQKAGSKQNLMLAMLHAADVNAELVAVRPPSNILYDPIWKLPTDNNFIDYLIIAKDGDGNDIWLDPRARYAAAGEIGEDFCGGTGFILGLNKSEFVTVPQAPESRYTIERSREYVFNNNNASIKGTIKYSGTRGWEYKENFVNLNNELRLGIIEEILSKSTFGINVSDFELPHLTTPGTSFIINYNAGITDFLSENIDGEYGIPLALPEIKLLPSHDVNNRKTPYHLSNFIAAHDKYTYILPQNSSINDLPKDIIIRAKFGYYSLCFSQENNKIIMERKYNFQPQIIALNDWQDYLRLSQKIKQIENKYIWFENK